MKLVLLSGGSGKRLWPLSNDARSKQFLKVLDDGRGGYESMVQRVWRQLNNVNLAESAVVATSKSQVEALQSQLGEDVPLIVEPERRDTFPAIALAASYLYSKGTSLDEVVAVLPVDPFVEDEFFLKLREMETVLTSSGADLALLGVEPTFPSEKYGYIVPSEPKAEGHSFLRVSHFKEKPTQTQAAALIRDDALWNCGVFCFRLGFLSGILESRGLPVDHESLLPVYGTLPKKSFDYEVVENTRKIVAVPYVGGWKDLGTWNTLTEEMDKPVLGRGIAGVGVRDTHIVNELDIPVAVLGISDAIIAVSADGILVSSKAESPKIKEMALEFARPMYEDRRWGWYRVLDYTKYEGMTEVLTRRVGITAGKNISYHYHQKRKEVWNILCGRGEVIVDGRLRDIGSGDVLEIPPGVRHAVRAIVDLELIEIQSGEEVLMEDVHRLHLDWAEIVKHIGKASS